MKNDPGCRPYNLIQLWLLLGVGIATEETVWYSHNIWATNRGYYDFKYFAYFIFEVLQFNSVILCDSFLPLLNQNKATPLSCNFRCDGREERGLAPSCDFRSNVMSKRTVCTNIQLKSEY